MKCQLRKKIFFLVLFTPLVCATLAAQTGPPAVSSTGTPLVAYRLFFRHMQALETAANAANEQDIPHLRQYYQNTLGLSDQETAKLKQISAAALSAFDEIEQQARDIIRAERAKYPGGKLSSKNAPPPPPPELGLLQKQRDSLTNSYVQSLQTNLSAVSFSRLDTFVKSSPNNRVAAKPGVSPSPPSAGGN